MDLSLSSAIAQELDRLKRPIGLAEVVGWVAKREGVVADLGSLERYFRDEAVGSDPAYVTLSIRISAWDAAKEPTWAGGDRPGTRERRAHIYRLLELPTSFAELLDERLGREGGDEGDVIISEDFQRWYDPERAAAHAFYWTGYSRYLAAVRGFNEPALRALDQSTTEVVERLSDPSRPEVAAKRGLVVGHVQSGKTAHFTGVIAKAVDAGYRLVIVLGGTIDLLRNQTQRRIDMELVGVEQIELPEAVRDEGGLQDYWGDPDWESRFIRYGAKPSPPQASSIVRLTRATQDYVSLGLGASGMATERRRPDLALNASENLPYLPTHLVIVKKNVARLRKLRRDLAALGENFLRGLPALIIDDESDQASVNTVAPPSTRVEDKEPEKQRAATNKAIVELLAKLPRAQYVGYTATPYANVLIDPTDIADLFPRDFIISLTPPPSYMGAAAFHDLGDEEDPGLRHRIRENDFVRNIWESDPSDTTALEEAIDAFVLAGMIKLFREKESGGALRFRHHTMLLHESSRKADHAALAATALRLWMKGGFYGGTGVARLRDLFESDFLPTSEALHLGYPTPTSFDEVAPFLGSVLSRIESDGDAVLVVNSDYDAPNFDTREIWRLIVGGQKLSRGYTIEGLTTSYFRRKAAHAEALMQMGRWFGFRPGYRDLVRLYIGRAEGKGARKVDLYEYFEAALRDEEAFREQLARYAAAVDGSATIRPIDVQPLVYQSNPQLRPVAKNKLHFSRLASQNFGGTWIESGRATSDEDDRRHNLSCFEKLLEEHPFETAELGASSEKGSDRFDALVSTIAPDMFVGLLEDLRWPGRVDALGLELEYLRGRLKIGDPEVDGWFIVVPLLKSAGLGEPVALGGRSIPVFEREYVEAGQRFKVFSTPRDRRVAKAIVHLPDTSGLIAEPSTKKTQDMAAMPRHGICLLYPTRGKNEPRSVATPGIAFAPPRNGHPRHVIFIADTDHSVRTVELRD